MTQLARCRELSSSVKDEKCITRKKRADAFLDAYSIVNGMTSIFAQELISHLWMRTRLGDAKAKLALRVMFV